MGRQIVWDEFTYNDIGKVTAADVNLFDMGEKTIKLGMETRDSHLLKLKTPTIFRLTKESQLN